MLLDWISHMNTFEQIDCESWGGHAWCWISMLCCREHHYLIKTLLWTHLNKLILYLTVLSWSRSRYILNIICGLLNRWDGTTWCSTQKFDGQYCLFWVDHEACNEFRHPWGSSDYTPSVWPTVLLIWHIPRRWDSSVVLQHWWGFFFTIFFGSIDTRKETFGDMSEICIKKLECHCPKHWLVTAVGIEAVFQNSTSCLLNTSSRCSDDK